MLGMGDTCPATSALEAFDISSRPSRADRLLWLAQFHRDLSGITGPPEVMDLREEARVCYMNGLYVATLLTALACVEQMLSDELRPAPRTKKNRLDLESLIRAARKADLVPGPTLDDADRLRELRNAFSHQKDDDAQAFRLGVRVRVERKHPRSLLEADAQLAIRTMYAVFHATLRPFEDAPTTETP